MNLFGDLTDEHAAAAKQMADQDFKDTAAGATPPIREMLEKAAAAGVAPPREMVFPNPRLPREQQQEQATRDTEIDPAKYYPPDVARELLTQWPKDFRIDLGKMLGQPPKP